MVVHDFHKSLEKSHSYIDAPWWWEVYQSRFPNLEGMVPFRQYGRAQINGIDRRLVLSDGTDVDVDEKVREQEWPDFLLEYYSSKEAGTPGWIEKDLLCRYISYYFIPSGKHYLLDFKLLQEAWRENKDHWIQKGRNREKGFRIVEADNEGYTTESVAVPRVTLWQAYKDSHKFTWEGIAAASYDSSLISQDEFLNNDYSRSKS